MSTAFSMYHICHAEKLMPAPMPGYQEFSHFQSRIP